MKVAATDTMITKGHVKAPKCVNFNEGPLRKSCNAARDLLPDVQFWRLTPGTEGTVGEMLRGIQDRLWTQAD